MIYYLPKFFQPFIYSTIKWYYRKPRDLKVRGLKLRLLPGVFHPGLYLSTDIFLDYILTLDIKNRVGLELGCGNGLMSLYLAKNQGVTMYASDINETAIKGINQNAIENNTKITSFHSDLFDQIPAIELDFILINPPYYAKDAFADNEKAFFAGENLEYFDKLFRQLDERRSSIKNVYFVLSENAPVTKIFEKALPYSFKEKLVKHKSENGERFEIYSLDGFR